MHAACDRNLQSVNWIHISIVYAKMIVAGGIFGIFCVSHACIFGIFLDFCVMLLWSVAPTHTHMCVWHASVYFFRPSSLLICSESEHIWQRYQTGSCSFVLFTFVPFFCVQCREVSNVLWVSRMCCCFWSRWCSVESSKWHEVCCCYCCIVLELKANWNEYLETTFLFNTVRGRES